MRIKDRLEILEQLAARADRLEKDVAELKAGKAPEAEPEA